MINHVLSVENDSKYMLRYESHFWYVSSIE